MIKRYIQKLRDYALLQEPDFGDGESILTLLYEAYNEVNRMDNTQIKADFNELYRRMNGMELREMDRIIYPVCALCRDHERTGFVNGLRIGIRLYRELANETN